MKVILVVYTNVGLSLKQVSDKKLQKYAFRTEEDLKVGDIIESRLYTSKMQVVDVIDNDYSYYNALTGELRNDINSTRCYPIKKIVLREDDEITVYATKVEALWQEHNNSLSIEAGDYDTFNDVVMKVSYFYGYTDVVSLSEKDFEKLRNFL